MFGPWGDNMSLKVLSWQDIATLQDLLEKCSDYLTFQNGSPLGKKAAEELFTVRPEGTTDKQKLVCGIYKDGTEELIGVFDLVQAYVGPAVLSLGLMVLEPAQRGQGTGSSAYRELEAWARSEGFQRIRIGVLFSNDDGLRFWRKHGFLETGEVRSFQRHLLRVLEKKIV